MTEPRFGGAFFGKAEMRNQSEARRVLSNAAPYKCCAVCGLTLATCVTIAHLNHDAGNNTPENLAWLCQTHHWMYDAGLYPVEAIRLMQRHWQTTQGQPDHKPRMKDAAARAALTRAPRAREIAARAVAARRRKALDDDQPLL